MVSLTLVKEVLAAVHSDSRGIPRPTPRIGPRRCPFLCRRCDTAGPDSRWPARNANTLESEFLGEVIVDPADFTDAAAESDARADGVGLVALQQHLDSSER